MKARVNLTKIFHNLSQELEQELKNNRNGSGFGSVS